MLQPKDSRKLGIVAYLESRDILGYSLGPTVISRLVQQVDLRNSLVSLSKLAWLIEESGGADQQLQIALAEQFLPEMVQIRNLLIRKDRALFFQHQIQVLMKHVACHSHISETSKPVNKEDLGKLGLALLAVNDLITLDYKRGKREHEIDNDLKSMTHQVFSTSYLVHRPSFIDTLIRSRHLYIKISEAPASRAHHSYIDLNKEFYKATGVELSDYLIIGIGIIVYFFNFWQSRHSQNDLGFIEFNPRQWFSSILLDPEMVDRVLNIISMTPADFKAIVVEQNSREIAHDFLAMKSKPLFKLNNETYIPISFAYLFEKLTTGIYWTLFDHLSKEDRKKLSIYNGFLFQEYVLDLFRHINEPERRANEQLLEDQPYKIGKQEFSSADAMLIGEDYVILVEASATRLQAKRTTSLGLLEAFESDCKKMILDNARSLNLFIENIETGKGSIPGIESEKIKIYYPVIVLIEGFPQAIESYIRRELEQLDLLSDERIAPLSILNIEELEAIAGYSDLALVNVLKSWHEDPQFPHTLLASRLSPHLKSEAHGWYKERGDEIFGESSRLKSLFRELQINDN